MSLLSDAETLVTKAESLGADQSEFYLERGSSLGLELEQNRLSGSGLSNGSGGAVRVIKDRRLGFAYFTTLEQAPAAIESALAASKLAEPLDWHFAGSGQAGKLPQTWFDDVAELDVDTSLRLSNEMLAGVHEAAPDAVVSGGINVGWDEYAIATSEGAAHEARTTHAQAVASAVLADGEGAINAWEMDTQHDFPAAHSTGLELGTTIMSLRNAKEATTGKLPVIFQPEAVSELITGLIGSAVDGDSAKRGKSFWSNDLGETVAPGVTLVDDPLHMDAVGGSGFDGEGRVTQATDILRDGKLRTFTFDGRDAARHKEAPTGHAIRGSNRSPPHTGLHHLVLTTAQSMPEAKLLDIDDGYLINSVLGAHTANATTGDFSVTAANVWRVQGGELTASKEVAIGGNLPELLQQLDASSQETRRMPGAILPALRFQDVQVSA